MATAEPNHSFIHSFIHSFDESRSTGEKGVGFKSVFTKSTEPWVYTTHVDAPHEHVHFSLPAKARATSVAVQPTFDTLMLMAPGDDDAAEASRSIPYITPFPLDDEKLGLVSALLDEVNRVRETGVSLESGTVLALKLDKNPKVDAVLLRKMITDKAEGLCK